VYSSRSIYGDPEEVKNEIRVSYGYIDTDKLDITNDDGRWSAKPLSSQAIRFLEAATDLEDAIVQFYRFCKNIRAELTNPPEQARFGNKDHMLWRLPSPSLFWTRQGAFSDVMLVPLWRLHLEGDYEYLNDVKDSLQLVLSPRNFESFWLNVALVSILWKSLNKQAHLKEISALAPPCSSIGFTISSWYRHWCFLCMSIGDEEEGKPSSLFLASARLFGVGNKELKLSNASSHVRGRGN